MNFTTIITTSFSAQITFELEKGYTQEFATKKEVVSFLQEYQSVLFIDKKMD